MNNQEVDGRSSGGQVTKVCATRTEARLSGIGGEISLRLDCQRQLVGHPVGRSVVIRKAQEMALLGCGQSIGKGWYKRFKERYPDLTGRLAQSLALKRNCVVPNDLNTLFNTLAKLVIELKLNSSRIFYMDETAFQKRLKSKKVVSVRGSSNVWSTELTTNFHLSIVACGSAAGYVVPPALILPGKTVSSMLLEDCGIPGAAVMTSPSSFINTELFEGWIHVFVNAVPNSIQRPLVLILDGCTSHYSTKVVDVAAQLRVMLVFLPSNLTHLLQPLDVAVFDTLKNKIRNSIEELIDKDDNGCYTISKGDAVKVTRMAWTESRISRNVQRGFNACGLFPLSLVKMEARLTTFKRNGVSRHAQLAAWLQMKTIVQDEILKLSTPPSQDGGRKRTRVDVSGRLLTHDVLKEAEASKACRRIGKSKKTKRAIPRAYIVCSIIESALV